MQKEMDAYSSPLRKLANIFKKGRDGWKRKCQAAKQKLKKYYIQIRDLKISRNAWKKKAMVLKKRVVDLEHPLKQLSVEGKKTKAQPSILLSQRR
jgi:hypothetical protein